MHPSIDTTAGTQDWLLYAPLDDAAPLGRHALAPGPADAADDICCRYSALTLLTFVVPALLFVSS